MTLEESIKHLNEKGCIVQLEQDWYQNWTAHIIVALADGDRRKDDFYGSWDYSGYHNDVRIALTEAYVQYIIGQRENAPEAD